MKDKRFSIRTGGNVVHLFKPSGNAKTGQLDYEVFHLVAGVHPSEARKSGLDAKTVCQGCPLASGQGCYVNPMGLSALWRALQAGKYPEITLGEAVKRIRGKKIRFGAYGNPSTLGRKLQARLFKAASLALSYDHNDVSGLSMISVHSAGEAAEHQAAGRRTYRTLGEGEALLPNEIMCPHTAAGVSCADCGLCDASKRAKSIAAPYHGSGAKKAKAAVASFRGIEIAPA
jgi:hypothetical protein